MAEPTGLAEEQLRALDRLSRVQELESFYLAGGTAICFHLKHRRSLDLDLFSCSKELDLRAVREALLAADHNASVVGETDAVLKMRLLGEPVDLVRYPYPLLEPPTAGPSGMNVAGLMDLAVMKLSALARRGIRRDFWDLHAILETGITLREAGDAYVQRFGLAESDLYHVARSLTYFVDAEKDPAFPAGLSPENWERIRAFFTAEAPTLLAR